MTTLREAAQQALEALEDMLGWQSLAPQTIQESAKGRAAALRAALVEDAMQKFTDVNQELMAALGCDHCNHPLYAAIKCRVCGRVTEPAPPQRKPLTREQAIALWADKSDGPSNGEIVSFARAIERAHGIGVDE